jgi:hypothetical protein
MNEGKHEHAIGERAERDRVGFSTSSFASGCSSISTAFLKLRQNVSFCFWPWDSRHRT